jgi:molybdopterin-containing oxidoreductase family iron-sulfur binding subunit
VAIDQDKCIGCQYCILACPYGARTKFVQIEPYYSAKGLTPFEKVVNNNHQLGVVGKCDFCADRLEEGLEPACVQACPAIARIFGNLEDPKSEVTNMLSRRNARPLLPEVDAEPSVYYIEVERR